VFRSGLLRSDSQSTLSQLISEYAPLDDNSLEELANEFKKASSKTPRLRKNQPSGQTSLDSRMGETPANYNK
jgi:hypothetical protein